LHIFLEFFSIWHVLSSFLFSIHLKFSFLFVSFFFYLFLECAECILSWSSCIVGPNLHLHAYFFSSPIVLNKVLIRSPQPYQMVSRAKRSTKCMEMFTTINKGVLEKRVWNPFQCKAIFHFFLIFLVGWIIFRLNTTCFVFLFISSSIKQVIISISCDIYLKKKISLGMGMMLILDWFCVLMFLLFLWVLIFFFEVL